MLIEKDLLSNFISILSVKNQSDLAKNLGVSNTLISEWKSGKSKPSLEILSLIVDKSGCSWDELLTGRMAAGSGETTEASRLKDELIASLREQIADKERIIELQREQLEGRSENSDLVKSIEKVLETAQQGRGDRAGDSAG